jgi:hypothetical protein
MVIQTSSVPSLTGGVPDGVSDFSFAIAPEPQEPIAQLYKIQTG